MLKLVPTMTIEERLQEAQDGLLERFRQFWCAERRAMSKFGALPEVRAANSAPASIGSASSLLECFQNNWRDSGRSPILFATDADALRMASVLAEAGAF